MPACPLSGRLAGVDAGDAATPTTLGYDTRRKLATGFLRAASNRTSVAMRSEENDGACECHDYGIPACPHAASPEKTGLVRPKAACDD
ncbi:MAG: hypothetical protein HY287_03500 [Planctomycetes bacterium]|nr:hypothetical protein [Planctomycetota bacterium]MBI3833376.1 hypothetical protein [Planctomycetota bacterium]